MKEIKTLTPFKKLCITIGNLPSSYVDSMSYYESLIWLCKYLEKTVIPAVNNNAEAVTELQVEYLNLVKYVNNYFESLDIQEEINKKLDEMAESGQLVELIAEYLNTNAIMGFNTVNDLKSATNLINGTRVRTLGKSNYKDGLGSFYLIRTKTSSDVVDQVKIVSLNNYSTLIAELIPDNYIGDLSTLTTTNKSSVVSAINELNNKSGNLSNLTTSNKTNLVNAINEVNLKEDKQTEFVVFGDSWSDTNVTDAIWTNQASTILNLNKHVYAKSGAGFVSPSTNLISTQITNFTNDNTYEKSKVKYIVFLGGINDYRHSVTAGDLALAIRNNINTVRNLCPDAKIIYVSNCQYPYSIEQSEYWIKVHNYLSTNIGIVTYNQDATIGIALYNSANYFHLTQNGQKFMGRNIVALLQGGETFSYPDVRTFSDSDIEIKYSAERIKNVVFVHTRITPKTALNNKTLIVSDTGLSYGGEANTHGGIGKNYNPYVFVINPQSFTIASQNNMDANSYYFVDFQIHLSA